MTAPTTEQLLRLLRSDVRALIARANEMPDSDRNIAAGFAVALARAMRYPTMAADLLKLTEGD